MVWLDIDWLRQPFASGGTIVYRYRTGVLRPQMQRTLRNLAQQVDWQFARSDPRGWDCFGEGTVIECLILCDWSVIEERTLSTGEMEHKLNVLAAGGGGRTVQFVPMSAAIARNACWPAIEQKCTVIDEVAVGSETLHTILSYLEETTDLLVEPRLVEQPGFLESFQELVERGQADLPELLRQFDDRVLTCVDLSTHVFDAASHTRRQKVEQGRTSVRARLATFLETRSTWDLVTLVRTLDQRSRDEGWTTTRLVREIFGTTRGMLATRGRPVLQSGGNRQLRWPGADGEWELVAFFAATLLAWEERLTGCSTAVATQRRPDLVIIALDQMCRDFLQRACRPGPDGDCLSSFWNVLDNCFRRVAANSTDALSDARAKLVQELARLDAYRPGRAEPPWLRHLREAASAATVEAACMDTPPERQPAGRNLMQPRSPAPSITTNKEVWGASPAGFLTSPVRFEDVPGRTSATRMLTRNVRSASDGKVLILHGPSGVGKRTLARLYAKARLCANPTTAGSPCCTCEDCVTFENGNAFGYICIAAHEDADGELARVIAGKANTSSLADRRVTVLENADVLSAASSDALLKTIENGPMTFVLTVEALNRVRRAVRSRSDACRVRPLTDPEARRALHGLLEAEGFNVDEKAMDVLVALSKGLPGELIHIRDRVQGARELSLGSVRELFDLNWPEELAASWHEILDARGASMDEIGFFRNRGLEEGLRRVRTVLEHIQTTDRNGLHNTRAVRDPALLHLDATILHALEAPLRERAVRRGIDVGVMWSDLARRWLSTTLPRRDVS